MDRGVQEHHWTDPDPSQGRKNNKEAMYKPYTDGIDGEQLFQCLICLYIIYFVARMFFDGIVVFSIVGLSVALISLAVACGHIFCFWCAYRSVNPATRSECPRCRRPYLHIPRVCKALHLLLQRVEPEEYKARTENFQELEAQSGTFSPCLKDDPGASESFMELLREWYASRVEPLGMSRPSTESFDENGIHTPRPHLSGHQEGENLTGEQLGESSAPLEYGLEIDSRSMSKASWMRVLESFQNLPDSLVLLLTASTTSTWDSQVGGDLTTGSSGGEFKDTTFCSPV